MSFDALASLSLGCEVVSIGNPLVRFWMAVLIDQGVGSPPPPRRWSTIQGRLRFYPKPSDAEGALLSCRPPCPSGRTYNCLNPPDSGILGRRLYAYRLRSRGGTQAIALPSLGLSLWVAREEFPRAPPWPTSQASTIHPHGSSQSSTKEAPPPVVTPHLEVRDTIQAIATLQLTPPRHECARLTPLVGFEQGAFFEIASYSRPEFPPVNRVSPEFSFAAVAGYQRPGSRAPLANCVRALSRRGYFARTSSEGDRPGCSVLAMQCC